MKEKGGRNGVGGGETSGGGRTCTCHPRPTFIIGTATAFDYRAGRYTVKLSNGKIAAFKPTNLESLDDK